MSDDRFQLDTGQWVETMLNGTEDEKTLLRMEYMLHAQDVAVFMAWTLEHRPEWYESPIKDDLMQLIEGGEDSLWRQAWDEWERTRVEES